MAVRGDDYAWFWIGDTAYDGWTGANAQAFVTTLGEDKNPPPYGIFEMYLEAGVYYPIRVLYANGPTYTALDLEIDAPDGTRIFGKEMAGSVAMVQRSCTYEDDAPAFPPWGAET